MLSIGDADSSPYEKFQIRLLSKSDGASFLWLVAGVLLGSVVPFMLIVILPTNRRLVSPPMDRRSIEPSVF